MNAQDARQFVAQFTAGRHGPAEYAAFLLWLTNATPDELASVADEYEGLQEGWLPSSDAGMPSPEWVARLEKTLDGVDTRQELRVYRRDRGVRMKVLYRWIAAASVLILLGGGAFLYKYQTGLKMTHRQLLIESLTGIFSVPRGGDQQLFVLGDGSKVWLNAASSLRYAPVVAGSERIVQLSGEAFFDVNPNTAVPFRVLTKDGEIEALGTQFDVVSYPEESASRATLLEGVVKIISGGRSGTLKPGQQAEMVAGGSPKAGSLQIRDGVNTNDILAWRNGYFSFKNEPLRSVMRSIGRAYDVEVEFGQNVKDIMITGSFSRKDGLSAILQQLKNLHIQFHNNGATIFVTQD